MNAVEFAHNYALEHQYQHFLKKYPHIFKYVNNNTRQATNKDYYVPSSIQNECKVYSITFNETGCRKIGCFPKTKILTDCTKSDPTEYITIGSNFYLSCQPACHEISRSIDTEFKNGKCWQANTEKKIFALFPEKIHNVEVYQPMHKGLDIQNGDLTINKDYCAAFGLSFDKNECIAPIGQEIGEFFLGSSVYKSIKKASIKSSFNLAPPPVPYDVQNLNNWLEGSQSLKLNSQYQSNKSMPYIPSETLSTVYQNLVKDLTTDISVDLSIDHTLKVMKNRIPRSVIKFSNMAIDRKIIQSAMVKAISQSHSLAFSQVARGLFTTLSKVNIIMSIFGTISTIVDVFDPFNYNYVLDKDTISKVNQYLDYTFYRSNNRNVEITPEKIWNILESDMSMYVEKLEEKIDHYLKAVVLEDYNARNVVQKKISDKKKMKTEYNWHKIFHIFFVMVLLITAVLFIQYIAFFMLIYFLFILYNQPSFY